MIDPQLRLMIFDPQNGDRVPYPSHPEQYRAYHKGCAWLFNPFSGTRRDSFDVGNDPFGHLIINKDEKIEAYINQ